MPLLCDTGVDFSPFAGFSSSGSSNTSHFNDGASKSDCQLNHAVTGRNPASSLVDSIVEILNEVTTRPRTADVPNPIQC